MNKVLLILSVFFILSSCKDSGIETFNYSESKLQAVMQDLYFASEALEKMNPEVRDSFNDLYRNEIQQIHKVDMNLFESDIKVLIENPKRYAKIHKEIRDSLVTMEKLINKKKYD